MVNWLKASLKGIIKKEQGTCSSFSKCTRDGHLQQNHLRCSLKHTDSWIRILYGKPGICIFRKLHKWFLYTLLKLKILKWEIDFQEYLKELYVSVQMQVVSMEMESPVHGYHIHDRKFHPSAVLDHSPTEKKCIALLSNLISLFNKYIRKLKLICIFSIHFMLCVWGRIES